MSYDPKSYELAEHFLPSAASDRLKSDLAQAIQTCIEEWLDSGGDFSSPWAETGGGNNDSGGGVQRASSEARRA